MYSITELDIAGHHGEAIPNTFLRHDGEAAHLAIIVPGLGYTASMPLLYYTARILLRRGADVLMVDYDYNRPEIAALSQEEMIERLFNNTRAAFDTACDAREDYARITLAGKSLGTIAMAHLLLQGAQVNDWIWMTPMLSNDRFCEALAGIPHHGLIVAGAADRHYNAEGLARVSSGTGGESIIIEGADHGMELDDTIASIDALRTIMEGVKRFIT